MDKITTVSLADRVKLLIGKDSQYALAKFLNISRPAISRWYDGTSVMDDDTAVRCAFAVGLDPEHVLCVFRRQLCCLGISNALPVPR